MNKAGKLVLFFIVLACLNLACLPASASENEICFGCTTSDSAPEPQPNIFFDDYTLSGEPVLDVPVSSDFKFVELGIDTSCGYCAGCVDAWMVSWMFSFAPL